MISNLLTACGKVPGTIHVAAAVVTSGEELLALLVMAVDCRAEHLEQPRSQLLIANEIDQCQMAPPGEAHRRAVKAALAFDQVEPAPENSPPRIAQFVKGPGV